MLVSTRCCDFGWARHMGAGNGYRLQNILNDGAWIDILDTGRRADNDAMGQSDLGHGLDVVRDDIVAPQQGSARLGRAIQRQRTARTGAQVSIRVVTCGGYDGDDVFFDEIVEVNVFNRFLCLLKLDAVHHLGNLIDRVGNSL